MNAIQKQWESTRQHLKNNECDGWLLYDFRRTNPLACKVLNIPEATLLTRRFLYWFPAKGDPVKIVHSIESQVLDHLPGKKVTYKTWQDFEHAIADILDDQGKIAMEYSPRNANPYLSKVDAGMIDLVRECGVEVVSSGDVIQQWTSVLTKEQIAAHLAASDAAIKIMNSTWNWITEIINKNETITEWDVQQYIQAGYQKLGFISDMPPLCAVNANSADPHYVPTKETALPIQKGDFILIDLGFKQSDADGIYIDITNVAVADSFATDKQNEIFTIVREARDTASQLVKNKFKAKERLQGSEIDKACRNVINEAGYGAFFVHRTGHNIGANEHGDGAHLDSFETLDERQILPGTCFSIEPGIYLPGEFGVRLEHDILINLEGDVIETGGPQYELRLLL